VETCLTNKVILVTGGTGSFGTKFTEIVLAEHNPKALRIYSRDELKQLHLSQRLGNDRVRFLIGDVRDRDRLRRALYGVDVVVHAAALKQVPAAEYNPIEAVKTNINGTINIIDMSIESGVKKVIFISSDKAVQPVNLYGATKLVAEKLITQANAYAGGKGPIFSCARYGNVMGSRGSVIPLFLEPRNGSVPITDERMTRFWITLDQGVRFVIQCIARMKGAEIFVPKIPSMHITDMAKTLAPDARWEIIGIRPGEKLHEVMITEEEAPRTVEFDGYYIIKPQHVFHSDAQVTDGRPVSKEFRYCSATNPCWLTPADQKVFLGLNS
jgi:UDP-N-acetylglucosamine 4,6-dehydratase